MVNDRLFWKKSPVPWIFFLGGGMLSRVQFVPGFKGSAILWYWEITIYHYYVGVIYVGVNTSSQITRKVEFIILSSSVTDILWFQLLVSVTGK